MGRSPGPRRTPSSGSWYAHYVDAHWNELITRYQPSVLCNGISYPKLGKPKHLFADYYNWIPEGVINDGFSQSFSDFTTPEYAKYDKITPKKWESCRALGFSIIELHSRPWTHASAKTEDGGDLRFTRKGDFTSF